MDPADTTDAETFWRRYDAVDAVLRGAFETGVLFGLSTWPGTAILGEWDLADPRGHREVDYATRLDAEPLVRVHTDPTDAALGAPDRLADDVVDLSVDLVDVVFRMWRERSEWWALGDIGDHVIGVHSTDPTPDRIHLARVTDFETLLDGRRAFVRHLRGEDLTDGSDGSATDPGPQPG